MQNTTHHIRSAFNKASADYEKQAFLQKEVALRLDQKLNVINTNSDIVLDLGAGTGLLSQPLKTRFPTAQIIGLDFAQLTLQCNPVKQKICADASRLPIANESINLIASNLMMQWCPNLDNLFKECYRCLKNDGLFIFSTFGVDTLTELKKSWSVIDDKTHVNQFIDMHDIGDKLLAQGFQSPIMEMENITLTYQNVIDLLKELKSIGANNVAGRSRSLTGKNKFQQMLSVYETYRTKGKLPATYEIIYGHAWKKDNLLNGLLIETLGR